MSSNKRQRTPDRSPSPPKNEEENDWETPFSDDSEEELKELLKQEEKPLFVPDPVVCVSVSEEGADTECCILRGMTLKQLEVFDTLISICQENDIPAWYLLHVFMEDYSDYETKTNWSKLWLDKDNFDTFLQEISKETLDIFMTPVSVIKISTVPWFEFSHQKITTCNLRMLPAYI